jgi:outer membrane protein
VRSVLTGLACAAALASRALAQEAGSLDAVLDAAARNHPVLLQQEAELRVAAEQLAIARAAYRPSVTARASVFATERDARLTNGGAFDRDDTQQEASIGIEQTLYDGGRRSLRTQIAVLSLRGAKARYEQVRRDVLASVASDLFTYRAATGVTLLNEELVALLKEELRGARARLRAGDASETDVATTTSRLELARSQALASALERDVALERLASVAGTAPAFLAGTDPDGSASLVACDLPEERAAFVDAALAADPALKLARLRTAIGKAEAMLARRTDDPVVALAARASTAREVTPAIAANDELSVGVSVTVPLYQGGAAASGRRRAAAQLVSTALSEREARRQAELRASQLFAQLATAKASLAAQRARSAAAEQAATGVGVGRGVGFYSTLDVLDAAAEGISAEADLRRTEAAIASTRFSMCLLVGSGEGSGAAEDR